MVPSLNRITSLPIPENQELLELDASDSLEKAFESLVEKKVHSAPGWINDHLAHYIYIYIYMGERKINMMAKRS